MRYRRYVAVDLRPVFCNGNHHGYDKMVPLASGIGKSNTTDLLKRLGHYRAFDMRWRKGDQL